MPRDNFAALLPRTHPHHGVNFERVEQAVSVDERQFRRHFKRYLGEGACGSKITARHWGVNPCRRAFRCLGGPQSSGRANQRRPFIRIRLHGFFAQAFVQIVCTAFSTRILQHGFCAWMLGVRILAQIWVPFASTNFTAIFSAAQDMHCENPLKSSSCFGGLLCGACI